MWLEGVHSNNVLEVGGVLVMRSRNVFMREIDDRLSKKLFLIVVDNNNHKANEFACVVNIAGFGY